MNLLDGKRLANEIRAQVKHAVAGLGVRPKLGVLLVGDDPASHVYVGLKEKAATEAGIETDIRRVPAGTPDEQLRACIEAWNADETVDGILVQLPLPPGHDTDAVVAAMDPRKDADGFHPLTTEVVAPVHESILRLIGAAEVDLRSAQAAIIANSETFSEPLNRLLMKAGCTVDVFTPDGVDVDMLKTASIVIVAVGQPGYLKRDMLKPGACVIDVGTSRLDDGRIVGDVDAESVKDMPGWLSPVPGGVGPMTVACLLKNVLALAKRRRGLHAED